MLDSVIRVNKTYYPQTHLEECKYIKYIIKKKKMENLINDDLDLRSVSESDNDEIFSSFFSAIHKKMEIKIFQDGLIDLRAILEVMEKIEISKRWAIEKIEETKKELKN